MVRVWSKLVMFVLSSAAALAQSAGSVGMIGRNPPSPSQTFAHRDAASGWYAIALWVALAAFCVWVVTHFRRAEQ